MLYVKYGKNRLHGFRGDVVWKCWRTTTTDGCLPILGTLKLSPLKEKQQQQQQNKTSSANHVVIVLQVSFKLEGYSNIRLPENCYGWSKDIISWALRHGCSDKTFLTILNTERAKRARKNYNVLLFQTFFDQTRFNRFSNNNNSNFISRG